MNANHSAGAVVRRSGADTPNRAFDLPRTFVVRSGETEGGLSQWVEEVPPGAGPPMHVHHREAEIFRILTGRFRFWCAGEVLDLGGGDTILVPKGAPHAFRNVGATSGELLVTVTPGGAEGFFEEVERLSLHPSRDMPRIVEIAARFHLEFVGPPPA